ncbi:MAG: SPFH domain-containing protein [archaeon]
METSSMKSVIFLLVVILAIAAIIGLVSYQDLIIQNLLWIIIAIVILLMLWRFDYVLLLKEYERAVIYRFGRVNRVGGPGWTVLFPPVETSEVVDTRVHTIDIKPQTVVTKDKIELKIDAIIYLKVKDDRESVTNSKIKVENYENAAETFVQANIRDVAGSMTATEIISSINILNREVKKNLEEISKAWGIQIEAVEIQRVDLPREILDAMHHEKAAEQQRLARLQLAQAHGAEITAVKNAAENLSDRALAYYYVRALEKMSEGKSTKLIFPMEISRLAEAVSGRMGGIGPQPQARSRKSAGLGSGNLDNLFRQYKPAIDAYLASQGLRLSAVRKARKKK